MADESPRRNPTEDRIEWLVQVAGRLGMNQVRVRWKLIRLHQRWQRWQRRNEQSALHINYEHKTCPACGSVNDRDAATCARCSERLPSRRWQMLQRIGIVVPRALSVSTLLAVAILLVYAREMAAHPGGGYVSVDHEVLLRFGAVWPPLLQGGQWWRLSTAIFLHIGLLHLGSNLVALAQVGPLVEQTFGRARMIFLFMLTGVLGFLGSYWLGLDGVSAGASGALMGLIGAAAGWGQRDGTTIGRSVRNHMLKWGAYTMVFGYFIHANNSAHAAGFVAGALLGWVTPSARQRRRSGGLTALFGILGTSTAVVTVALALFPPTTLEQDLQRALEPVLRDRLGTLMDELKKHAEPTSGTSGTDHVILRMSPAIDGGMLLEPSTEDETGDESDDKSN
jgi:rhomboid protease GluP